MSALQYPRNLPQPGAGGQGVAENNVIAAVLATTGKLAHVAGLKLRPDLGEIMPLIIDAIQDSASYVKRQAAVKTLGQVGVVG